MRATTIETTHDNGEAGADGGGREARGAASSRARRPSRLRRWTLAAVVAIVVAGLVWTGRREIGAWMEIFLGLMERAGPWGPALYVLTFAVAVLFFVPVTPFLLAAGAFFGVVEGALFAALANVLGGVVSFLSSRYLFRERFAAWLGERALLRAIDRAIGRGGLATLFWIRLNPAVPASLMNYGLGLTSASLRNFVLAAPAMLPTFLVYAYYGRTARDLLQWLRGGGELEGGAGRIGFLLLGLVATAIAVWLIGRQAKKQIDLDAARTREETVAPTGSKRDDRR